MAGLAVVLDTNVLLSGLAYPASVPGRLIAALRRTLPRLVHRHGLTPEAIDDLIDTLAILAELVEPEAVVEGDLTDRDDLPVLGTLLAAWLCPDPGDWRQGPADPAGLLSRLHPRRVLGGARRPLTVLLPRQITRHSSASHRAADRLPLAFAAVARCRPGPAGSWIRR